MKRAPLGSDPRSRRGPRGSESLSGAAGADNEASDQSEAPASGQVGYSWPLRVFLVAFVVDMVVRSALALTPYDGSWRTALAMDRFPLALPTAEERRRIDRGEDREFGTVSARYYATLSSFGEYINPWPNDKTRGKIDEAVDVGRYAVVWIGTRLNLLGALFGLDQNWPMFAPNVRQSRLIPRARLVFEDGSAQQIWLLAEPWDLTEYGRWFIKRPLQIDIRLHQDYDARLGVSQHLSRVYPVSSSGSPVRRVELHKVRYRLPAPNEDAYAVLSRQSRKPLADDPFWRYDVVTGRGQTLEDRFERRRKERLQKPEKASSERSHKPKGLRTPGP